MDESIKHICPHCRALDARLIGVCVVCTHAVCERCGNVQVAAGERRVAHNECLKHDSDSFTMIKFVR